MNQAEVDNLMYVTRWAIRDWKTHAEWDDILAEAYGAAWRGYQDALRAGYPNPLTWAVKQARWAPIMWHRQTYGRKGQAPLKAAVEWVPLKDADGVAAPPFEPALIDQVARFSFIARLLARCTPQQRRLIERMWAHQETGFAAARGLGIAGPTAHEQVKRVREKCRDLLEEMR